MKKIFILIIVIFISLNAFGCSTETQPVYNYNDFEHLEHWDDLLALTANKTIIYYYSPYCDICIQLEESVTKMLKQLEPYRDIYLADDGYLYGQGDPGFELFGVPALIILLDGEFYELVRGSLPVVSYLENELIIID